MSANRYTTNPLTGRTIRVGGPTFNQLVMEAYDYIDGRLVRRAIAPLPSAKQDSYLNVETGRMVQWGTRTYFSLIQAGYEIIEDYYLIPSRFATVAWIDPSLLHIQDTQVRLERLNFALLRQHLFIRRFGQFIEQRRHQADNQQWVDNQQREAQLRRLTELNIALCRECQMPVNLNELPANGLCEDCGKEIDHSHEV